MDASGIATAHGAHVIIKEGFEPDEYDNALADKLAAFMPRALPEKLVRRSDLANPNRAAARGIELPPVRERLHRQRRRPREARTATWTSWRASTWNASASLLEAPPQPSRSRSLRSRKRPKLGGTYRCTVDYLRVRDAPGLGGTEVAHYSSGETVTLDNWYKIADGYVWGRIHGLQRRNALHRRGQGHGQARGRRLSGEGGIGHAVPEPRRRGAQRRVRPHPRGGRPAVHRPGRRQLRVAGHGSARRDRARQARTDGPIYDLPEGIGQEIVCDEHNREYLLLTTEQGGVFLMPYMDEDGEQEIMPQA